MHKQHHSIAARSHIWGVEQPVSQLIAGRVSPVGAKEVST